MTPNLLIVLFDDVGFSDFGCYGSPIRTPTIDRLAAEGLRYAGFHTTAMCSTTRASLLTGRNHHSVGMGCLANFDSGTPGYRGIISNDASTLAEMLRPHGYRNYMVGKWHVTPLTQSGPTGPFDGWPLRRGFDRFYGFLDAETDQFSPELVVDNHHVDPPTRAGYHLSSDLVDNSITMLKSHVAAEPDEPWFTLLSFGACHAPHQAPDELVRYYDEVFADGWDVERERRLARQIELGIVSPGTVLPDRNPNVAAWADHSPDEHRLFRRLQGAYAAMLDHADQQLGRLISFLEAADQFDDTIVMVLSDNGASQEGGPQGFVNAMGPFNGIRETMAEKLERIDDIGGPDTHSNFPWGWAMAANTPLRRYKQNTHGGGVRDPLVIRWPGQVEAGAIRHEFCHVSDVAPTLLDALSIDAPSHVDGVQQKPVEGVSFQATFAAAAKTAKTVQYFEMFGHRGVWLDGWKAVAYHQPGTSYDDDQWELFDLTADFNEVVDLASTEPERLNDMVQRWWSEAEAHQVLPLDDRFAERFAENAARHTGDRKTYVFWNGMGHLPNEVAPDLRSRSYVIRADLVVPAGGAQGVVIAHGDATSGYSLYFDEAGHLVHDLNIGGSHQILRSAGPVEPGTRSVAFRLHRVDGTANCELLVDGSTVAEMQTDSFFFLLISWSGLDIGFDRGSPVSHYTTPNRFTGGLEKVTVDLLADQDLDLDAAAQLDVARD